MRRDEDGTGKGDGLVTYLKQPSVDLAIQILDGTLLRDGDSQPMSVSQVGIQQTLLFPVTRLLSVYVQPS